MNFLSKILQGVAYLPTLIMGVESLFGPKTGDQKRAASVALVGSILNISEAIAAKDIVDNNKFQEGLKKAIEGVVEMLNASVWAKR